MSSCRIWGAKKDRLDAIYLRRRLANRTKGYLKRKDGKVTIQANFGTPIREKNRGILWMTSSS